MPMMPGGQRFPFTAADPALGQASLLPLLPLKIIYQDETVWDKSTFSWHLTCVFTAREVKGASS